ncbi:LuxR family transcriptional regulator [Streptomyces sp. GESEQ-35]|uniref:helix-turn-helix transcriptional regulator n=1 Tax=Streptomyces sp. GESEQ-35 TaxID=2812657 RepID=UPI001B334BB7|nr:LuxR family transcriptional regulator [Streptomyces sp. GESEQ-35]
MAVDERAGPQRADRPGKEFALLDRQTERAAIDRVLGTVRDGLSGTLVLRGAPGIGKTTLLRYAVDVSPDMQACTIAGVESEISMEFSGLHHLLLPFLPLVGELPPPQRYALRVAFGEETGPPPERFLVGLASLTLLSRAAEEQPLLCVVDDAHWLDPESAQVLGFVGRRLHADRVGLIVAVGEPAARQVFEHLPTITVDGLPDTDARGLLSSVAGGALNAQAVDRILADTRNNPLALVELGSKYTADQLSGHAALPEPLPLGRRLQEHFLRQVRGLQADAQAFTLLAAADPERERAPLWRAAVKAGIDPDAASAEAAWSGVLEFSGSSVRFRYPLVRSAVYYGADAAERRRAHQVLGEAGNPELRAWHLAAAATAPDEKLAAELQWTAERAAARGGYAARAALLRRSADLTPDDGHRAVREVALAEATLMAGDPPGAQTALDSAKPRLTNAVARGHAQSLEGAIRFAQGDAAEAARILAGASQVFKHDDRLARDTMLGALEAAIWSGPVLTREIARLAHALPPVADASPSISDLLLEGYSARFTLGYQASVQPFRAAVTALLADDLDPAVGLRWFALGAAAAGSLWDDKATFEISDRWVNLARAAGAFTTLPVALAFHAVSDAMAGHFREADARWAMMLEVLTVSHGPAVLGTNSRSNGVLLAYRGHVTEARATGLAQVRESAARSQGGPADIGRYNAAMADLFAGNYEAAMSSALTVIDDDPAYTAEGTMPELIEAAVRAGRREVAATAYRTLSERALAAGTPWGLGLRSRCEALLAEGADAEGAYLESISQLKRCRMVVDLARTHLLYGQWLRRAKRRRDARHELYTAYDMFAAMGAERFAEQAAVELRAIGERTRTRAPETALDLTPQESRIADLAAAGASNSEIAANLFVSPSTVDYHLRKVFRKLNVTSRTQLAAQLTSRLPAGRRT